MSKSHRWRAANAAYNEVGLREARRGAQKLKDAFDRGDAKIESFELYSPDGKESITLKQVVMK